MFQDCKAKGKKGLTKVDLICFMNKERKRSTNAEMDATGKETLTKKIKSLKIENLKTAQEEEKKQVSSDGPWTKQIVNTVSFGNRGNEVRQDHSGLRWPNEFDLANVFSD